MTTGTQAEMNDGQSLEYRVVANEATVLRIEAHGGFNNVCHVQPASCTSSSTSSHPWQVLLCQPPMAPSSPAAAAEAGPGVASENPEPHVLDTRNAGDHELGIHQGDAELSLQSTATSTVTSLVAATGTQEEDKDNDDPHEQPADVQALPPDDSADDISTQGLLEGLDDLYDIGGLQSEDQDIAANEVEHRSARAKSSTKDEPAELEDMDLVEAETIVRSLGGFGSARRPANGPEEGSGQAAEKELADMGDQEAQRILDNLGGFSIPKRAQISSSRRDTRSGRRHCSPGTGDGSTSEGKDSELADMADKEAQRFIQMYGGFSKPAADVASYSSSDTAGATPPTLTAPHSAQAAQPRREAAADSGVPTSTPNSTRLFPSRNEVLSARKALKLERRSSPATARSPLRTPVRRLAPKTPRSKPQLSLHASLRDESPASSGRRLSFKSPSLKRPSPRLQFNSPSKRVARDSAGSHLRMGTAMEEKPTPPALQFSQPFHSPGKANGTDSRERGAGSIALQRHKEPPKLPPVTSRARGPALVQANCSGPPPPRVFDMAQRQRRHSLLSVASEMGAGDPLCVPEDVHTITAQSAADYSIPLGADGQGWGSSAARQALLACGCSPEVVTEQWVRNHFRWSVWSCASYARRFPAQWREFWSIENITSRLLYRYEREFVRGERSALKKILEADASPQQLMVLCVAAVFQKDGVTRAEVTDGWYSMASLVDPILAQAIARGRLRVGDKIACCGLRMSGISEGASPLSAKAEGASLMLNANCVRRAPWHAKLGFQPSRAMFLSLAAIYERGGPVGAALDVVVLRNYPMLYMETLPDGRRVVRSEKEECRVQQIFEGIRSAKIQDIAARLTTPKRKTLTSNGAVPGIGPHSDGEDLFNFVMNGVADPDDATRQLTPAQREALDQYAAEKRDEDESAVLERLKTEQPPRKVRPLFKLLVCDYPAHRYKSPEKNRGRQSLITVWGPRNVYPADFAEGSRFILSGLTVSPPRGGQWQQQQQQQQHTADSRLRLNFNAGSSRSRPMPADPSVIDQCDYYERGTLWVDELRHIHCGQEVDVRGAAEEHVSGAPSQMSLLRLSSAGESGTAHYASIEFSAVTFGSFSPAAGDQVTVRNCLYTRYDDTTRTFILKAGDVAEFVV